MDDRSAQRGHRPALARTGVSDPSAEPGVVIDPDIGRHLDSAE
ncbi:hypothetical protein [Streptoalloteichus hindustanus]|nr:hypothetical protein [Streptoalloteichus hindustanus]